jgi:hypothetical protein
VVWILLALPAVALPASPEIFLQEEPETYLVIDKLEGMGFLPGLMTGDRGLEAREVTISVCASGSSIPATAVSRPTRKVGRSRRTGESVRVASSGPLLPTGFLSRRAEICCWISREMTPDGSRRHPCAWAGHRQRWRQAAFPSGGDREGTAPCCSRPTPSR